MPATPLMRLTHALRRPEAAAAIEALRGTAARAAVEGLIEVVYFCKSSPLVVAAIDALRNEPAAIVNDALGHALGSPHAPVRTAALQALPQRCCHRFAGIQ